MQISTRLLALVLISMVGIAGLILAQPPGGPPPRGNGPSNDDLLQRLLKYDANKDGKISKDELPERMQHLVEMGDTNKDGTLDKQEIIALAERLSRNPRGGRPNGPGGPPPGPGGFAPPGPGGPPGGPGHLEQVLEELNLSGATLDKADAVVRSHQRKMRKLMDQAREDLLKEMQTILSKEEFNQFKEAMNRPPPPPPPPPQD